MKQFFISAHLYQTKNQAHNEIQEIAKPYDKCLIDEVKLKELKSMLRKETDRVNLKYTRCHNLELRISNYGQSGAHYISIESNFQLSITEVKRFELLSNQKQTTFEEDPELFTCSSCGKEYDQINTDFNNGHCK